MEGTRILAQIAVGDIPKIVNTRPGTVHVDAGTD